MATTTSSERIPTRSRSRPSSTYLASRSQGSSPVANPNLATLPPLNTSQSKRRPNSQRISSAASKRASTFSNNSAKGSHSRSRPQSTIIPQYQSSLSYALVRDFAYPLQHPMHYGPPAQSSGVSTPSGIAHRRLSDYSSSTPADWTLPGRSGGRSKVDLDVQLPSTSYADGPPWPEEEDLHSPIVTSAKKNRDFKSDFELDQEGDTTEYYGRGPRWGDRAEDDENDSGEITPNGRHTNAVNKARRQQRRDPTDDSYFGPGAATDSPDFPNDQEDSRYSRDYSFTIASPDEEMHGKAVALYDFAKENENELPLVEGQVLWVSYRHIEGWLVAQDPKSGESGLVPEAYIRLLRDIEGGLGGLSGMDAVLGASTETEITQEEQETKTPVQSEPPEPPSPPNQGSRRPSNQPKSQSSYTPVVSHFSTSSNDLQPYPQRLLSVGSQSGVTSPQTGSRRISEDSRIDEKDEERSEEESSPERQKEASTPTRKDSVKG